MKDLGFYVIVYDDREGIATMNNNIFANEKKIISYDKIGNEITESEKEYVTIMTFGHIADELVLKQLIRKKIKYLGMMGSASKVNQIYMNLLKAGYTKDDINNVHSPIGVSINSKTPEEIAISIAAEIIKIKNQ
jgi:xanthine dehydrogenase accessory factor